MTTMKPNVPIKFLLTALLFALLLQLSASNELNRLDRPQDMPKYGHDSVNCVINISLYREFMRQWRASNFESPVIKEIIGPWNWVFKNCPLGSENTYIDGVRIMQYRIENEKNPAARAKLIDTLMMVYDQRLVYFPNNFRTGTPQRGAVLGRKGVDLFTYDQERYEQAYGILKESVELEGQASDGTVLIYYFRSVTKMARKAKVDTAVIVDVYDQVVDILDHNITRLTNEGDTRWVEVNRNVKNNIEATFEPFASCPDLVRVYRNKLKKTPNDVALLRKVTALLDRRGCQDDPLYLESSVNLHRLEPSPESAFNIGRMLLREEKVSQSIPYFEEATKSADTDRAQMSFKLLAEAFRVVKNFPRSRQMALRAIELNPNDGAPYITIGDLYAASAKDCGNNDFTSRVAYWAAVDKYNQAKRVDASQAEAANRRIATFSAHFPSVNVIFFHGYEEGQPYTIDCWFREETIIRASK